jgi:hypothetical protein
MKKQSTKASIILRKTCVYWERGGRTYPVPELLLLANRNGFRWLSKFFAEFAEKDPDPRPWNDLSDPDDHDHISWPRAPIDCQHSDEMEIRVGIVSPKNRTQVFEKYSIESAAPYRGTLKKQYQAQIRNVIPQWNFVLQMEKGIKSKARLRKGLHRHGYVSMRAMLGT